MTHHATIRLGSLNRGWKSPGSEPATPKAPGVTPKDGSRSDSDSAGWRDWVRSLVREMRMTGLRSDSGSTGWPDGVRQPAAETLNVTGPSPHSGG